MSLLETTGVVMDVQAMEQAKDINASEDVGIYDFLREKKYVKDKDLKYNVNPRLLPFPEPYQVATAFTGIPWNVTNYTCLVQFGGCDLDCDYCFCGETKTKEVTVEEVYNAYWKNYNENCPRVPTPVFRISGGEPFLQQDFLVDLLRVMKGVRPHDECIYSGKGSLYYWVDTNLTVKPSAALLETLSAENVGVCGCFKPVAAPYAFEAQLKNAKLLIDAGVDMYFYYPCSLTEQEKEETECVEWTELYNDYTDRWDTEFKEHLDAASYALGEFYPCRVHPIKIGYDYSAVGGEQLWSDVSMIKQDELMYQLREYISGNFGDMYYWLPDYQVDIANGVMA